jgi:hypothetical protein
VSGGCRRPGRCTGSTGSTGTSWCVVHGFNSCVCMRVGALKRGPFVSPRGRRVGLACSATPPPPHTHKHTPTLKQLRTIELGLDDKRPQHAVTVVHVLKGGLSTVHAPREHGLDGFAGQDVLGGKGGRGGGTCGCDMGMHTCARREVSWEVCVCVSGWVGALPLMQRA